jgi:hypothetical protein
MSRSSFVGQNGWCNRRTSSNTDFEVWMEQYAWIWVEATSQMTYFGGWYETIILIAHRPQGPALYNWHNSVSVQATMGFSNITNNVMSIPIPSSCSFTYCVCLDPCSLSPALSRSCTMSKRPCPEPPARAVLPSNRAPYALALAPPLKGAIEMPT